MQRQSSPVERLTSLRGSGQGDPPPTSHDMRRRRRPLAAPYTKEVRLRPIR
jgi:hypothetical protein